MEHAHADSVYQGPLLELWAGNEPISTVFACLPSHFLPDLLFPPPPPPPKTLFLLSLD